MKDEIKEILDRLKIKSDRYNYYLKYNMSYENKDEDYEAHLLFDYITNLEKKVNKMMSTLKEEVSYLMPYEIYHNEVDSIVEKVEKIAKGGGINER